MGTLLMLTAPGSETHQIAFSFKVAVITVGFPWKNMNFDGRIIPFIMDGIARRMWLDVDFC
jgi:hypothetical protein